MQSQDNASLWELQTGLGLMYVPFGKDNSYMQMAELEVTIHRKISRSFSAFTSIGSSSNTRHPSNFLGLKNLYLGIQAQIVQRSSWSIRAGTSVGGSHFSTGPYQISRDPSLSCLKPPNTGWERGWRHYVEPGIQLGQRVSLYGRWFYHRLFNKWNKGGQVRIGCKL